MSFVFDDGKEEYGCEFMWVPGSVLWGFLFFECESVVVVCGVWVNLTWGLGGWRCGHFLARQRGGALWALSREAKGGTSRGKIL